MVIPDWLIEKNDFRNIEHTNNKTHFLRRTIKNISSVFQNEFFCERFVNNRKLLQIIDPRVKLFTFLFFMILCSFTGNFLTLIFLSVIAFGFAKMSGLNLRHYAKRVWMYVPLLVLILSIPAATNIFIEGVPLIYIYKSLEFKFLIFSLPHQLYFSLNGILAILKMSLRIGTSISFCYLLIITTRWSHISKAFSALKIPKLFILILSMTYRYIFVLSCIAENMMEARTLRTIGALKNKKNRLFVAHSIAFLFIKSSFLSEEVFDAMRCRGFTGDVVYLDHLKLRNVDYLFIINSIFIFLILILGEIML